MAPEGARPEKSLERLFVVGGRLRAPSNYIFPVKSFAIGGRQTIAKGAFGAQGGHDPMPPLSTPLLDYFGFVLLNGNFVGLLETLLSVFIVHLVDWTILPTVDLYYVSIHGHAAILY